MIQIFQCQCYFSSQAVFILMQNCIFSTKRYNRIEYPFAGKMFCCSNLQEWIQRANATMKYSC